MTWTSGAGVREQVAIPEAGYTYVGELFAPLVDADVLRFSGMNRLEPVPTGCAGDDSPIHARRPHPNARFAVLDPTAAERVVREGFRRTYRMDEDVTHTLDGFAAEHGQTPDQVLEAALRAHFTANDWEVYERFRYRSDSELEGG